MGPITILTLDSTNGIPDETTTTKTYTGQVYSENDSVLKEELWAEQGVDGDPFITTDTQGEFKLNLITMLIQRYLKEPHLRIQIYLTLIQELNNTSG